mmetsp:Transcript_14168/g.20685  ORF Transcript_14168/g.20685 Transcript_14168/m.20685 type:complete len:535 (-) Transcript_14168:421-2025(-)
MFRSLFLHTTEAVANPHKRKPRGSINAVILLLFLFKRVVLVAATSARKSSESRFKLKPISVISHFYWTIAKRTDRGGGENKGDAFQLDDAQNQQAYEKGGNSASVGGDTPVKWIPAGSMDPCYIHTDCSPPNYPMWYDSSDLTLGPGWYCNDGQAVHSNTDMDYCFIHPGCSDPNPSKSPGFVVYDYNQWVCWDQLLLYDPWGGGSPRCLYGDPTDLSNFCGGIDSDNPWAQLSCSPYQYRPFTRQKVYQYDIDDETCGRGHENPYYEIMANGEGYGDTNYPNYGTNAWAADFTGKGNTDYWVFHACDGAGLQSDCAGDSFRLVERFEHLYTDSSVPPGGLCDRSERNYCKFVHPGTENVYTEYRSGWWGDDCKKKGGDDRFGASNMSCISRADFKSKASGDWSGDLISNILNIPENYFGGVHPFAGDGHNFSFLLFWWRCSRDENFYNTNLFSYPSIKDVGYKCYTDNEPGYEGHPFHTEIYFGTLTKDSSNADIIKLYRFDSYPDGSVSFVNPDNIYVLYPVHQDDWSGVPY